MKFIISTPYDGIEDQKTPCDEAKLEEVIKTNYACWPSLESAKKSNAWIIRDGFNHREIPGINKQVAHDYRCNAYTIELNSLTDLISFVEKYGRIAINFDNPSPTIEIYHECRE